MGLVWMLALMLATAGGPLAQEPDASTSWEENWERGGGGDVSFGGRIEIGPDEVRNGDVTCIGGAAIIQGTVHGDVNVIGGRLDLGGTVDGNVNAIASSGTLRDGARVTGDLHNIAGHLRRGKATVEGELVDVGLGIALPGMGWLGFLSSFFLYFTILELLLTFLTLLLLAALVPERIRLTGDEAAVRWPGALLAGIGGYAGLCIALFLLFVTVIGIPLVFLLWCVFFVFKTLALAGIFHLLGSRLGRTLGREMSLLGSVLLGFLPFALVRLTFSALGFPVSVLGWFAIWMPLQIVAVGLMMLTRGGGRRQEVPAPVVVPPPPPPPPAPGPAAAP